MSNPLSAKVKFSSLMKFTLPTIIMMIFMSIYIMVDGIFVARFVNTDALSAVNITYPALSLVVALGIMIATGGSAIVAKQMGEGKDELARRNFSMFIYLAIIISVVLGALAVIFVDPLIRFLGANDAVYRYCHSYVMTLVWFIPAGMLQMLFQYFFVTAGKPVMGLVSVIAAGLANIVLDYIFIVPLGMGIAGAALATGIGYCIPSIIGICFFCTNRKGTLWLCKARFRLKTILLSCSNGASELVTNIAVAVTTYFFNITMMRTLGSDGVAAITIVLYTQMLLNAVFMGYASGVAPVFSYKFGSGERDEIKKTFRISVLFIGVTSILVVLFANLFDRQIVGVFADPGTPVFELASRGFAIFSVAYLFMGFNIFSSAMFTAFSNGLISALLSFLRTLGFTLVMILVLPLVWGVDGLWLSVPIAESLALIIAIICFRKYRTRYGY